MKPIQAIKERTILLHNQRTERHQRQLGHFEALLSDWNAKDRDAPETAQNAVSNRHLKAKDNNPNQVDEEGKASTAIHNFFPKREKGETCEFEALQANGYADDGDAPKTASQYPGKPSNQSSK